jgi:quinol-cytochrome oxidoreductase complex cytochrome b subunit
VLLVVELGVLAATGVALLFVYRPDASGTFELPDLVRAVHRWVSRFVVPTAIAQVALAVVDRPRRRLAAATGGAQLVGALAAGFTGFLLPWDQLALWAVTVGGNLDGYRAMFTEELRFVLINGTEVGPDTILRWLGVHTALGVALLVVAVLAAVVSRRRTPSPS